MHYGLSGHLFFLWNLCSRLLGKMHFLLGYRQKCLLGKKQAWLLVQVLLLLYCLVGWSSEPWRQINFAGWLTCYVMFGIQTWPRCFPAHLYAQSPPPPWDQAKQGPGTFTVTVLSLYRCSFFADFHSTPRVSASKHFITFPITAFPYLTVSSFCGHASHCDMYYLGGVYS